MDYKILTLISLDELKPKLISIETHNTDGKNINFELITKFMRKNGFYIHKRVGPTTLFSAKS